jgi:hypothetical protein
MSGIRIHNFRSINRKRENDDKKEKKNIPAIANHHIEKIKRPTRTSTTYMYA